MFKMFIFDITKSLLKYYIRTKRDFKNSKISNNTSHLNNTPNYIMKQYCYLSNCISRNYNKT